MFRGLIVPLVLGILWASVADAVGPMFPITSVLEFNAAGDPFESRGENPNLIQETLFRFNFCVQSYHL